ncbi:uncharacterized protein LOC126076752 [Elephas maximus indicus]|uniref:uncharacterized protein LOC126076752 n=1 Tax=Elephas maximus indicus TaxID=99487 RepID=UPI0021160FA9|nr:uncharacterized protein LOC126076752 [Elephas maximus indicus]
MRTAAAAAAAGARSPPLPARPLSPPLAAPPPPGAGPGGEPRALLEGAAAAVPSAARARPRGESPAGASVEAPGAPSPPHLLWPLRLRGGELSYRLKITRSERCSHNHDDSTGPGNFPSLVHGVIMSQDPLDGT